MSTDKRLDKCCNFKTFFFSFLHMHMSLQSKCFTFESKKTKFTHISRMHFRTKSWNTFSSELSHLTFTFLSTISQKHFWKNGKNCKHFIWYFKNLCQSSWKELMHSAIAWKNYSNKQNMSTSNCPIKIVYMFWFCQAWLTEVELFRAICFQIQ